MNRKWRTFSWKEANFRICASEEHLIIEEIIKQRRVLDSYISRHPEFKTALTPIQGTSDAPDIVQRMQQASAKTGVGPMAAVAGTTAQMAAEAALLQGGSDASLPSAEQDVIVENGGDLYLSTRESVVVGLYAGDHQLSGKLAFLVEPERMPLAICSSSSRMGHSLSFGQCDLATVVSKSASLADAAATHACNLVTQPADIDGVLEQILAIDGILGVLVVKEDRVGLAGDLPELVRHDDREFSGKITKAAGVVL